MKAPDFIYARPHTLAEAFQLKLQHGESARWLSGGQSLLAALAFRLSEPSALIDVSRLEALQGISVNDGVVRIGAGTTHAQLGASTIINNHVPLLHMAVPFIAHAAIRNRGTIGGSLAFADPAAELPACCVALDATIIAASAQGERRIAARDFFHGVYATALRDDELIVAIEVPVAQAGEGHSLDEITRRSGDYAMAGIASAVRLSGANITAARFVFFALGDRPIVAASAAAALVGHDLDDALIERAAVAALDDIDPAGDQNGGPAMKRHLAQVLLRRDLHAWKLGIAHGRQHE